VIDPAARLQEELRRVTEQANQMQERYDAEKQELISRAAGLAYPIRDGIPIMLADEAREINRE
jgi:uncharacterized protein YbaR (Trm112 family)